MHGKQHELGPKPLLSIDEERYVTANISRSFLATASFWAREIFAKKKTRKYFAPRIEEKLCCSFVKRGSCGEFRTLLASPFSFSHSSGSTKMLCDRHIARGQKMSDANEFNSELFFFSFFFVSCVRNRLISEVLKKLWPEHSTVWCERWTFGVAAKTITFMNNGHTPRNKYQNAIFSKFYIAFFNGCSEKRAVERRAERNFTATNKYFQNGVFHGTANDEMTENNNSVWMMCVWNFSLFAVCWSAKRQALKPQNTTIIIFMFII